MAISREKKEKFVKEVEDLLLRSKVVFLVDFTGVKAGKISEFRSALKKLGARYKVIKKTLAALAFSGTTFDFSPVASHAGSLALIAAEGNELEIAKLISDFKKENETLTVVGGYLERDFLPKERVSFLAKIPSREILLSQLAGLLQSPIRGIVVTLAGNLQKLSFVLKAIERSKQ